MKPIISIIAAIGRNRELGKNNKLLWNIPEDMKHFRDLTSGHAVIMGRKTFESIGRPLPNRTNIVITRETDYRAPGCTVVHSLEQSLEKAKETEKEEIFVIGGGQIYEIAMPYVDKLYLTIVDADFEADAYFPEYTDFKTVVSERKSQDEHYRYRFLELVR